jgi:hypothetical protein
MKSSGNHVSMYVWTRYAAMENDSPDTMRISARDFCDCMRKPRTKRHTAINAPKRNISRSIMNDGRGPVDMMFNGFPSNNRPISEYIVYDLR